MHTIFVSTCITATSETINIYIYIFVLNATFSITTDLLSIFNCFETSSFSVWWTMCCLNEVKFPRNRGFVTLGSFAHLVAKA